MRYIPADPAGNLTALVLTPVAPDERAEVAAKLIRATRMEQAAFVDMESLTAALPRMDMMGGEFCGNATRAFGLFAAMRRGRGERELRVSVSGAKQPVPVTLDAARGRAFARMAAPYALEWTDVGGRRVPVVRMEGIAHAVLFNEEPSPGRAKEAFNAMPDEAAQGVLFVHGRRMTPVVFVAATGTLIWESSCGSGSVALAWMLARETGERTFVFEEPGGTIETAVDLARGLVDMGGAVRLGEEREIALETGGAE